MLGLLSLLYDKPGGRPSGRWFALFVAALSALVGFACLVEAFDSGRDAWDVYELFASLAAVTWLLVLTASAEPAVLMQSKGLRWRETFIAITTLLAVLAFQPWMGWVDGLWGAVLAIILLINGTIFILFSIMLRPLRWKLKIAKGCFYWFLAVVFLAPNWVSETSKPTLFWGIVLLAFSFNLSTYAFSRYQTSSSKITPARSEVSSGSVGPLRGVGGEVIPMRIRIWMTDTEQLLPFPYIAELWNFFTVTLSKRRGEQGATAHHATLECGDQVYVSFCPLHDLAHLDESKSSGANMKTAIRMDRFYSMPARWRSSVAEDLGLRGEPTVTIEIKNYSYERLQYFVGQAKNQLTYHVTRQNCCTTVVDAVEYSVDGVFSRSAGLTKGIRRYRQLLNDLMMLAGTIRFRAQSFAWTTTGLHKYLLCLNTTLKNELS